MPIARFFDNILLKIESLLGCCNCAHELNPTLSVNGNSEDDEPVAAPVRRSASGTEMWDRKVGILTEDKIPIKPNVLWRNLTINAPATLRHYLNMQVREERKYIVICESRCLETRFLNCNAHLESRELPLSGKEVNKFDFIFTTSNKYKHTAAIVHFYTGLHSDRVKKYISSFSHLIALGNFWSKVTFICILDDDLLALRQCMLQIARLMGVQVDFRSKFDASAF